MEKFEFKKQTGEWDENTLEKKDEIGTELLTAGEQLEEIVELIEKGGFAESDDAAKERIKQKTNMVCGTILTLAGLWGASHADAFEFVPRIIRGEMAPAETLSVLAIGALSTLALKGAELFFKGKRDEILGAFGELKDRLSRLQRKKFHGQTAGEMLNIEEKGAP
ncbi:MAG: hypothetical protein AAB631_02325 [Patescibacteria group bacterium]